MITLFENISYWLKECFLAHFITNLSAIYLCIPLKFVHVFTKRSVVLASFERELDVEGISGTYMNYAFVIFSMFTALLIFIVLWKAKKLNMEESTKFQVFEKEIQEKEENHYE